MRHDHTPLDWILNTPVGLRSTTRFSDDSVGNNRLCVSGTNDAREFVVAICRRYGVENTHDALRKPRM
jgi:hypothetical protein